MTLTYRTTIEGAQETVNLPLRLLVMGDFSLGSSEDRKVDLEERRPHSMDGKNLDAVMKDMMMSLDFTVKNRINPDKEGELKVHLPISRLRSFSPDEVARHVPKVRALLLIKTLLQELVSNIDNRKELRKIVQEIFGREETLRALRDELKGYAGLQLPAGPAPAADVQ